MLALKVTESSWQICWLAGFAVMEGASSTVKVAAELVMVPQELLTRAS